MKTLTPNQEFVTGIFPDMPESDYRKADGMNQTLLKNMRYSCAHFRHEQLNPNTNPPSPSMIIGLCVETLLWQRQRFDEKFVVEPKDFNPRTTEGKAWKKAQAGKHILDAETLTLCENAAQGLLRKPHIAELLASGRSQVPAFSPFSYGGTVQCKALIDWIPNGFNCLCDLKTTRSARKEDFSKDIAEYGYDVQAAFYLDVYKAATGDDARTMFAFIVVENTPPHEAAVYVLDPEDVGRGRAKYINWLARYMDCLEKDHWPGYQQNEPETITLPKWARKEEQP